MNRYPATTPRAAFGTAAFAMTALTIGLLVVGPAQSGSGSRDSGTLTKAAATPSGAIEVAIVPSRIDVIAVRPSSVATATPALILAERG